MFWTFFKMGALTFGGGYAMLPILQTGLIAAAGCTVLGMAVLNLPFESVGTLFRYKALILMALLLVLTNLKRLKNLHPVVFIAFAAVFGIVLKL